MSTTRVSPNVSELARKRGITEVVHFSTNLGLTGCLNNEMVLPRNRLKVEEKLENILTLNAPFRSEEESWFDKTQNWINYINLSISEITTNLFRASLRWHEGRDIYWLIMSFDVSLLDYDGVYFTTTNNIYPRTIRGVGPTGFEALFAHEVYRKPGWRAVRGRRPSHLTTCEQAEVLFPDGLPMSYLRRVYVRTGEEADRVHAVLSQFGRDDVEVEENADKFHGKP